MIRQVVDGPEQKPEVEGYYQTLFSRLATALPGAPSVIGVTSSRRGEGVSTVARKLALAAADHLEQPVLLIESDQAHSAASSGGDGLDSAAGLAEVLQGSDLWAAIQPVPDVAHLSILPAGGDGVTKRLYDSRRLPELIERLKRDFSFVVFDLPPVGEEGPALQLGRLLDGVLLVVEAESVRWEVAQRARDLLLQANARVLGAVLNKRRQHIPHWLYRTL